MHSFLHDTAGSQVAWMFDHALISGIMTCSRHLEHFNSISFYFHFKFHPIHTCMWPVTSFQVWMTKCLKVFVFKSILVKMQLLITETFATSLSIKQGSTQFDLAQIGHFQLFAVTESRVVVSPACGYKFGCFACLCPRCHQELNWY